MLGKDFFDKNRLFVDREEYKALFEKSLKEISPEKSACIFFYGEGGIGKSALLKEFEEELRAFTYGKLPYSFINLANEPFRNPENALFRIRKDLGKCGMKFPLFDSAYLIYWEKVRPHIPLKDDFKEIM